jgi:hypothetical protein
VVPAPTSEEQRPLNAVADLLCVRNDEVIMELILADAIGVWESEGGAPTQPGGPLTSAMKSSSGKGRAESRRHPELARAEFGKTGTVWSKAPRTKGYEPGRWQERNIGSRKATKVLPA